MKEQLQHDSLLYDTESAERYSRLGVASPLSSRSSSVHSTLSDTEANIELRTNSSRSRTPSVRSRLTYSEGSPGRERSGFSSRSSSVDSTLSDTEANIELRTHSWRYRTPSVCSRLTYSEGSPGRERSGFSSRSSSVDSTLSDTEANIELRTHSWRYRTPSVCSRLTCSEGSPGRERSGSSSRSSSVDSTLSDTEANIELRTNSWRYRTPSVCSLLTCSAGSVGRERSGSSSRSSSVHSTLSDSESFTEIKIKRRINDASPLTIQAINDSGISYNRYETLNISDKGIVLHLKDKLVTDVDGPIRIILEVTGLSPSHLDGCLSVAGATAEVVIANPNGIIIGQGCDFMHVMRVLLTTGQPRISPQGKLQGYQVRKGTLAITGELNLKPWLETRVDFRALAQVDLLARCVTVNASVYAKCLHVITGCYEIPHFPIGEALSPIMDLHDRVPIDSFSREIAISLGFLSVIQAQQVTLLSREYAATLKSQGLLEARHLRVDVQGKLMMSGRILSHIATFNAEDIIQTATTACSNYVQCHAKGQLVHHGTIAAPDLSLSAPILHIKGQLKALNSLLLEGNYLTLQGPLAACRTLQATAQEQLTSTGSCLAGTFYSSTTTKAPGKLMLYSRDTLSANGIYRSTGTLSIEGSSLKLENSRLHADSVLHLKASQYSIDLHRINTMSSQVILETPKTIFHKNSHLVGSQLTFKASNLINSKSKIEQEGSSPLILLAVPSISQGKEFVLIRSHHLKNNRSLIQSTHDCLLESPTVTLSNSKGKLIAGRNLLLDIERLHNKSGYLEAVKDLVLGVPCLTDKGTLSAGQRLHLKLLTDYTHTRATHFLAPHLLFDTTGWWMNESDLCSSDTLCIQAAHIYNTVNGLIRSDKVELSLSKSLKNQGRIYGATIRLAASELYNKALLLAEPPDHVLQLARCTGLIRAREGLYIGVQQLYNLAGSLISSDGVLHIGGHLGPETAVNGSAKQLVNISATINANRDLSIHSEAINNKNAYFFTQLKCIKTEERLEYQPMGEIIRYSVNDIREHFQNGSFHHLSIPNENNRVIGDVTRYGYTRTHYNTIVTHSYPALIQSGQHMQLAKHVVNDKSDIIAGGTLSELSGFSYRLDTSGAIGQYICRDKGYTRTSYLAKSTCVSTIGIFGEPWHRVAHCDIWWHKFFPFIRFHEQRLFRDKVLYESNTSHDFDLSIHPGVDTDPLACTTEGITDPTINYPKPTTLSFDHLSGFGGLTSHRLYTCQMSPLAPVLVVDDEFKKITSFERLDDLSSDYLLCDKLKLTFIPQRLGSGPCENDYVREQIRLLTRQRYLVNQESDEATFKTLMDAAYLEAKRLGLKVGVPLTQDQMNQLTHDIVWMIDVNADLDEPENKVLAPKVYLASNLEPQAKNIAAISAKRISLTAQLVSSRASTLVSQQGTWIKADVMNNQSGQLMSHRDIECSITQSLRSIGGQIEGDDILLKATQDIELGNRIQQGELAMLSQTATLGARTLSLKAGCHIKLEGAQFQVLGKASIEAAEQMNLISSKTFDITKTGKGPHCLLDRTQRDVGTQIYAEAGLILKAREINVVGSALLTQGILQLQAKEAITCTTATHQSDLCEEGDDLKWYCIVEKNDTSKVKQLIQMAVRSVLSGATVQLSSKGSFHATGLKLSADHAIQMDVEKELRCESAENTYRLEHKSTSCITEAILSRWQSVLRRDVQKYTNNREQHFYTPSQLSTQGSLTIHAGQVLYLKGIDITASDKVQLSGSKVEIKECKNTQSNHTSQKTEQLSLPVGLGEGLAAITQQASRELATSPRIKSNYLLLAKQAQALYNLMDVVRTDPKRNKGVAYKQLVTNLFKKCDVVAAFKDANLTVQVALDGRMQSWEVYQENCQAQSSSLKADTLLIQATQDDLILTGSQLQAVDLTLEAAKDLAIKGAVSTTKERRDNWLKSMKFSINPLLYQTACRFKKGQQKDKISSVTHQQSQFKIAKTFQVKSGGEIRLDGIKVSAEQVIAEAASNLVLSSPQDTWHHTNHASESGFRIGRPTFYEPIPLSLSWGTQEIYNQFKSVKEKTVLKARQGFDISVQKLTHLIGATIESNAPSDQNRLLSGTIQCDSLKNEATYKQSNHGVQLGTGSGCLGTLLENGCSALSFLMDSPKKESTVTEGGIIGLSSDPNAKSFNAKPKHEPVMPFDTLTMQEKSELSQTISRLGMQVSGDIVDYLPNNDLPDYVTKGVRIALHAGVAGTSAALGNNSISGAVMGVVAGDLAVNYLSKFRCIQKCERPIRDLVKNVASGAVGAMAGRIIGGKAGAFSGASQAMMADRWNRQLHETEAKLLAKLMKGKSKAEQQRIIKAALYLTKASAGVPENDPYWAEIDAMQAWGEYYLDEIKLLKETELFRYTEYDRLPDWFSYHDEEIQRGLASMGMIGCIASIAYLEVELSTANVTTLAYKPKRVLQGLCAIESVANFRRTFRSYQPQQGARVLNALNIETFPGEQDKFKDFFTKELVTFIMPTIGTSLFARYVIKLGDKCFTMGSFNLLKQIKEVEVVKRTGGKIYETSEKTMKGTLIPNMTSKINAKPISCERYPGTRYEAPHKAGIIGIRQSKKSGLTMDVNPEGKSPDFKIHIKRDGIDKLSTLDSKQVEIKDINLKDDSNPFRNN